MSVGRESGVVAAQHVVQHPTRSYTYVREHVGKGEQVYWHRGSSARAAGSTSAGARRARRNRIDLIQSVVLVLGLVMLIAWMHHPVLGGLGAL
jgi:hypothetical protein